MDTDYTGWPIGQIIFTAIVGVLTIARLTRLIVFDKYPPAAWARDRWRRITHDGGWSGLVDCAFCAAPYVTVVVAGLGYFLDWPYWWYVACTAISAMYLAPMVVARDDGN